jgi:hypothetical protein
MPGYIRTDGKRDRCVPLRVSLNARRAPGSCFLITSAMVPAVIPKFRLAIREELQFATGLGARPGLGGPSPSVARGPSEGIRTSIDRASTAVMVAHPRVRNLIRESVDRKARSSPLPASVTPDLADLATFHRYFLNHWRRYLLAIL